MSSGNGALVTGLRYLSRDDIVAAHDLARETVDVPEWGGAVLVQALDVNRRLAYWEFVFVRETDPATGTRRFESRDDIHYGAVLCALGIISEDGEPAFTLADIELLGQKNPETLNRVGDVVLRLSRMGKYTEAVKAEAPLVQNGASPTDSPAISA